MKTKQQWLDEYLSGGEKPRYFEEFNRDGYQDICWRSKSDPDLWEELRAAITIKWHKLEPGMSHFYRPAGRAEKNERTAQPDIGSVTSEKRYCEHCKKELPADTRPHKKTCGAACRKALSRKLRT